MDVRCEVCTYNSRVFLIWVKTCIKRPGHVIENAVFVYRSHQAAAAIFNWKWSETLQATTQIQQTAHHHDPNKSKVLIRFDAHDGSMFDEVLIKFYLKLIFGDWNEFSTAFTKVAVWRTLFEVNLKYFITQLKLKVVW